MLSKLSLDVDCFSEMIERSRSYFCFHFIESTIKLRIFYNERLKHDNVLSCSSTLVVSGLPDQLIALWWIELELLRPTNSARTSVKQHKNTTVQV